MKAIAVFQAQAWVNDYAVNVDPLGATTWDVTEHLASLSPTERELAMVTDEYESDALRDLPNAPQWVKDWTGPFYVSVAEKEDA